MTPETSREPPQDEKMRRWHEIEAEAGRIGDKVGRGIDEQIKPAVVGLEANGFHTTASCEGHDDRALPWPWIDVESALAEQLETVAHYNTLQQKHRERKTSPEEDREMEEYIDEQIIENEKTYQQLLTLLEEFYRSQPAGEVARLIIRKGPWNQSRIQPEQVPEHAKPREIQQSLPPEEKRRNLELYRRETERLAFFLRDKFFSS